MFSALLIRFGFLVLWEGSAGSVMELGDGAHLHLTVCHTMLVGRTEKSGNYETDGRADIPFLAIALIFD